MTSDGSIKEGQPERICVGRSVEIAKLKSQFDLALKGQSSICYVKGDTGSGKSTLLRAFVSSLDKADVPPVIAWGHCDQQTGSIRPLNPWAQILNSLSGLSDVTIPEERFRDSRNVVQTIRSAFTELAPDIIELMVPGFGLAVRSARMIRQNSLPQRLKHSQARPDEVEVAADRAQLQDQYLAIIESVSERAPLLIVLDDLHRSDVASLQLLGRMAEKTQGRRILFLAALRQPTAGAALEPAIARINEHINSSYVDLDVAREQRGPELVKEYVDTVIPGVGKGFTRDLARHTGGHPLFVVELVEHFRNQGIISAIGGRWRENPELSWEHVPKRIENILHAQLTSLDTELLDILRAASVEGDQFTVEVVAAALEASPLSVARILARRAPDNLVQTIGTQVLGGKRVSICRFCHSMGRQHVYSGIDPLERTYLHDTVATVMESLAGDDTDDISAQLAYQFEKAGIEGKAREYYEIAAKLALSSCSLVESSTHLKRALGLTSARLDEMRLRHRLAGVELMMGNMPESAVLYAQARTIAEEESADELITILAAQASALARSNDLEAAHRIAASAECKAREAGDTPGLMSALETLAGIELKMDRREAALAYQQEALVMAEILADKNPLAACLRGYGWCLKEMGRYPDALAALQRSLEIQQQVAPNNSLLASTYNSLADTYISLENYAEARKHLLLAVEYWQRFDRSADVAVGLSNLANLANREGLFEDALAYARQAYQEDLKSVPDDHPDLAFALTCIGESLIGMRQYEAAIEPLQAAFNLRMKHRTPAGNIAWSQWLLGRALVDSATDQSGGTQHVECARSVFVSMGTAAESELRDVEKWLSDRRQ